MFLWETRNPTPRYPSVDDLINDCECNLVENKDANNNERDLDDYSIVSVECESVSTSSNNGNGSENNMSKHSSEKSDSDGFIDMFHVFTEASPKNFYPGVNPEFAGRSPPPVDGT